MGSFFVFEVLKIFLLKFCHCSIEANCVRGMAVELTPPPYMKHDALATFGDRKVKKKMCCKVRYSDSPPVPLTQVHWDAISLW